MTESEEQIKAAESVGGGDEPPTRLNRAVYFLLCALPIFGAVAFGAVDTWALGVISILTGLIVLLWLADSVLKKEFRYSTNRLQIPLFCLLALGLIQLLPIGAVGSLSLAPYATRLAAAQLFLYLIFFAAALVFINNSKRLRKTVTTIIIFGAIMAFYGILQSLSSTEEVYGFRPPGQANPFASFINRHHFAAFMEMTLGLTLALLFGKSTKKDRRIFLIIAAVIMGMAVIFTGSRGGLISMLGVFGFIITANLLEKRKNKIDDAAGESSFNRNIALVAGGLALLVVLFGAVIMLGGDQSLLRGIGLQEAQDDISNGRTHFWATALQIFFNHPLIGAGLDAFGTAFTRYDTWHGVFRIEQAHNDYLQILADGGIIGFACVAAFIFFLFKQSLRTIGHAVNSYRRDTATGALAGCLGILLHSFFDFPLRTTSNAYFFLLLVVIATAAIYYPKHARHRTKAKRIDL